MVISIIVYRNIVVAFAPRLLVSPDYIRRATAFSATSAKHIMTDFSEKKYPPKL